MKTDATMILKLWNNNEEIYLQLMMGSQQIAHVGTYTIPGEHAW